MPLWLFIIIAAILLIYKVNFYIKNPDVFKDEIKTAAIIIGFFAAVILIICFAGKMSN